MYYLLDDTGWPNVLKLEGVLALPPYKRRRIVAVSEDPEVIFAKYDELVEVARESCTKSVTPRPLGAIIRTAPERSTSVAVSRSVMASQDGTDDSGLEQSGQLVCKFCGKVGGIAEFSQATFWPREISVAPVTPYEPKPEPVPTCCDECRWGMQ